MGRGVFFSESAMKNVNSFFNKVINFCIKQQFVGNEPEIVVHIFKNATFPECLHTQNIFLSIFSYIFIPGFTYVYMGCM
jgi:hypothetical protein